MTEKNKEREGILKSVPLFSELGPAELQALAQCAVARQYARGAVVFSEGDACEGLYVIESGAVRIFKTSPSGREQVLALERAVSTVAELPVFDGGAYPASVDAAEDSVLLLIRREDFQQLCLKHPEVAIKVLRVVGRRLRRLVGIVEELSFTTVRRRLAALLVRLAKRGGKKTPQGVELTLEGSHQELAAHIGTVRELVSRNLSRLQAEGLVEISGKKILIPKLEALEEIVSQEE
jgi:CRP/FNR family cyclic AMP-dependent transcriptional regulator